MATYYKKMEDRLEDFQPELLLSSEIPIAPLKPDQAVVFDVDGTLTQKVSDLWSVRPNAARAVRLYADNGYKVVYLSSRSKRFQSALPFLLRENDFPEGSVHVQQSEADSADFKIRVLKRYLTNKVRW